MLVIMPQCRSCAGWIYRAFEGATPVAACSPFGERGGASLAKRPQAARSWWRRKLTNV
jgi:hypothetical protein